MSIEEKLKISGRSRALWRLMVWLKEDGGE
jgi:hypothetical protein